MYVKDSIVYSIRHDLNFTSVSYESMWIEILVVIKTIGGSAHFFTKINFGFYLKALSANYKLVFVEFKNII